jgi:hypothetical protein
MATIVYLDESGDLGWKFDAPYRMGGSSRYLTLAALCVPPEKKHLPKRLLRNLYQDFNWPASAEKKWSDMAANERAAFSARLVKLCAAHPDIHMHAITVKKERVAQHIRRDENKLYNYMTRLCLIDCMAAQDRVHFIPDARSIKVRSGNSLHDYLQTVLWFDLDKTTTLNTTPLDSHTCAGLQFADMVSGLIQHRFEDKRFENIRICIHHLQLKRLFF